MTLVLSQFHSDALSRPIPGAKPCYPRRVGHMPQHARPQSKQWPQISRAVRRADCATLPIALGTMGPEFRGIQQWALPLTGRSAPFFEKEAPPSCAARNSRKRVRAIAISATYPTREDDSHKRTSVILRPPEIELVKLQSWVGASGAPGLCCLRGAPMLLERRHNPNDSGVS